MKKAIFILISCYILLMVGGPFYLYGNFLNCKLNYKDFKYGEKVKIKEGFYQNKTGIITSQTVIYNRKDCNDPGFIIKLDFYNEDVKIKQDALEKVNE